MHTSHAVNYKYVISLKGNITIIEKFFIHFTCSRRCDAQKKQSQRQYCAHGTPLYSRHVYGHLRLSALSVKQTITIEQPQKPYARESCKTAVRWCTRWGDFSLSSKSAKLCPSHSISASSHSFPNFLPVPSSPRPLLSPPMVRLSPDSDGYSEDASRRHVSEIARCTK